MTTETLEYPVLTIAWNGFLATGHSETTLMTCSASGFDSGFYDSLRIIDSTGATYRVQAARKGKLVSGGLRRLLGDGLWRVDLDLAPGEPMGLPDVKAQVLAAIHQRACQWDEDGALGEVVGAVEQATTLQELMALFAGEA